MPGAEFRLPNEFAQVPLHGPLRLTGPWIPDDPEDFTSVFARAVARWLSTSEEPVKWRAAGGRWAVVGTVSTGLATNLAALGCTRSHEGWAVPLTNPYDVAEEMLREGVQLPERDVTGWLGRWADRLHDAGYRAFLGPDGLEVTPPESLGGRNTLTRWAARYLPDPTFADPQMIVGDPAAIDNSDVWYGGDADTDMASLSRDAGEGHDRPTRPESPSPSWDDGSDGDGLRMVEHALDMDAWGGEMDDHPAAVTARRVWDSLGHAAWCDLHAAPFGWRWRPTPTMHRLVAHSLSLWPARAQGTYERLGATALDAANHASSVVAAGSDHGEMPASDRDLSVRWLDTAGITRLDDKWFTAVPYTRFPWATRQLLAAPHAWHYWTDFPDEGRSEDRATPSDARSRTQWSRRSPV